MIQGLVEVPSLEMGFMDEMFELILEMKQNLAESGGIDNSILINNYIDINVLEVTMEMNPGRSSDGPRNQEPGSRKQTVGDGETYRDLN